MAKVLFFVICLVSFTRYNLTVFIIIIILVDVVDCFVRGKVNETFMFN